MHNDSQVSFDKCTFWFDEERVSFDEGFLPNLLKIVSELSGFFRNSAPGYSTYPGAEV